MTFYVPPGQFPTRALNKSVAIPYDLDDAGASARMGWRAPVFVHLPSVLKGPGRVPCLDVTGAMVAERSVDDLAAFAEQVVVLSADDLKRFKPMLATKDPAKQKLAFFEICRYMDAITNEGDSWKVFLELLEKDRFEPSAWFERDRKALSLTDNVTGDAIVSLWDEDVDEAIEGGFIRPPRVPRPYDSEWLPALLEYANEYDLVQSLRASRPTLRTERPRH